MFERLSQARRNARERGELSRLVDDCRQLIGERGESNSVAIAARAIERYRRLAADGVREFFDLLAGEFDPDPAEVLRLAQQYAGSRSPEDLVRLARAAEPPRQELLRRLNRAPRGTKTLVEMRAQLLHRLRTDRRLVAVDADFEHLLSSWFNPGFLRLVQVDWGSPALLLEKIIQHEAVHEIDGWGDLRRRLQPDRRCFAFFHPMLPDEPLIFVEVALLAQMPEAIAPLLDRSMPAATVDPGKFRVAAFYSISNCQPGLRGVNLGNFLIKRVAERLAQEFPRLRTFCTLSPIPSFAQWLAKVETLKSARLKPAAVQALNAELAALRARHAGELGREFALAAGSGERAGPPVAAPGAQGADGQGATGQGADGQGADGQGADADRRALERLCAFYLTHTEPRDGPASDPVARFHLNNGARLERINPGADVSRKGLKQSLGLMVNYLYDLDDIEANHERFASGGVSASRSVRGLL